jgi:hypothetical protein
MKFSRVSVDPKGSGTIQLFFSVSARKKPHAEHSRTTRSQYVPHSVSDYNTISRISPESFLTRQKQVRLWLCALDITSFYDYDIRANTDGGQRIVDFGAAARCRYSVGDLRFGKKLQQLDCARKWLSLGEKIMEEFRMPGFKSPGLLFCK